jgi:hypothetical protein
MMQLTKRILGGIAWTCAILLMPSASAQSGAAQPPGLTSKDYLRLMAEANEARDAALAAQGLTPGVIPTQQPLPQFPMPQAPPPPQISSLPSSTPYTPPSQAPVQQAPVQPLPVHQSSWQQNRTEVTTPVQPIVPNQAVPMPQTVAPTPASHGWMVKPSPYGTANPTLSASIEHFWLRRQGDNGTTWSNGGLMGSLGEDTAGGYRFGWYLNPMERYEFAFLGSFVWERSAEYSGPVNSWLNPSASEPAWFDSFQGSQEHEQTHTARLRSYELNKRWITDDLGNHFFGLQIIDYQEMYGLESQDPDGDADLGLETTNLLIGLQTGIELWRPISQRIALGGQAFAGLYGNFADGGWRVEVEETDRIARGDEGSQIAGSFGFDAKVRYQWNSRWQAFGGYRWWYLAGVATVDDQTIGPLASDTPFALSTDAGFLLQGATFGIELLY